MKYMVVYSSNTGNTQILAKAIQDALNEDSCVYYGKAEGALAVTQDADIVFVGFWVYKGSCTEEIRKFLGTLNNKKIVLFGTAGFGGSDSYFKTILAEVKNHVSESNEIIDSFMCQGKMPQSVLKRYEKMLEDEPDASTIINLINNFNSALTHPDAHDVAAVTAIAKKAYI